MTEIRGIHTACADRMCDDCQSALRVAEERAADWKKFFEGAMQDAERAEERVRELERELDDYAGAYRQALDLETDARGRAEALEVLALQRLDGLAGMNDYGSGMCTCIGSATRQFCEIHGVRAAGVAEPDPGAEWGEPNREERWVTHNVTDPDWHSGGGHWHPHRGPEREGAS